MGSVHDKSFLVVSSTREVCTISRSGVFRQHGRCARQVVPGCFVNMGSVHDESFLVVSSTWEVCTTSRSWLFRQHGKCA